MLDSPDNIRWHAGFFAATGLEFKDNIEKLEMIQEYNLSKEPIRIDLLIINDWERAVAIKNEIGHIMRKYNVTEYKSPHDAMSIDDFYKTLGYACLYKGYGESVDRIPSNELTVSMFRATYPRELFATLKRDGHDIEEKYPGIYYVTKNLPFPVQIVVTSQLDRKMHSALRILCDNADMEDVEHFLRQAREMKEPGERNNVDAVLQVSVSANYELYEDVRRNAVMCQALQELMKDEIAEQVNKAVKDTEEETNVEAIRNIMKNFKCTAEQAMDVLEIPQQKRSLYMSRL